MRSSTRRALKKHAELKGDWGNLVYSSQSPLSGNTRQGSRGKMIYTKRTIVGLNGKVHKGKWVKAFDPEGDYNGPYAFGENLVTHPRYKANMAEHQADYERQKAIENAAFEEWRRMRSKSRSKSKSKSRSRSKSRSKGRRTRRHR